MCYNQAMRKFLKILAGLLIAAAVFFVAILLLITAIGLWRRPLAKADAIIVLGAAINTPASYNRSLQGLKLYQEGEAPVLVLSGGVDYSGSMSEAVYMERVILAHASSVPNMILEPNSHSTYDNIENSKKLLPGAKSVIIVSDTFHVARGALMAKAAGFSPVYWSSPGTFADYPPGELVYYYLRETLAMIDYIPKFVMGR